MKKETIIHLLPYKAPFLFVEELTFISEDRSEGYYTLKKDEYFYSGHFKDNPVTPGVILIEIMAQIGLVCLGIYLLEKDLYKMERPQIAISNSDVDFLLPVKPKERVKVVSEKIYFRFNKLKCNVQLFNDKKELVCKGTISGMFKLMDD